MRVEITEAVWLDEGQRFSLSELADLSGLPESELRQLVEYAALEPAEAGAVERCFTAECLALARMARRLRNDFDLDASGVALTISLIERIRALEAEVRALQAQ